MSRINLEDSLARRLRHVGARFSTVELTLTSNYTIAREGASFHFLNPGGTDRTVRMPTIDPGGGQLYLIVNMGLSGSLNVVSSSGSAITTIGANRTAFITSSSQTWQAAVVAESFVPEAADYVIGTANPELVNGRVVTNTPTVTWDLSTPGIIRANTVSGGGNVSTTGLPATSGQLARWVDSTHIEGFTASFQPLDPDLTALAALTGTDTIYYRSAADTWSPVTIGLNLTFSGGTLSATGGGGGTGNVSTSGTITVGQYAKWATATAIQSVTPATVLGDIGGAPLASPTFTGDPKAPTPATADNDTSIATTAFVQSNLTPKAPLASPAFTGNPTAPTRTAGDNSTSIATTAFVANAVTASAGQVGDIRWSFDTVPLANEVELNGATIAGGVALYPALAARYPFMVSGADIRLPDARGCFPRIWAHGSGIDPDSSSRVASFSGGPAGDTPSSFQSSMYASHNHSAFPSVSVSYLQFNLDTSLVIQAGASYFYGNPVYTSTAASVSASTSIGFSGGNETRPTNIYFSAFMRVS